jgi:hypothetical protein
MKIIAVNDDLGFIRHGDVSAVGTLVPQDESTIDLLDRAVLARRLWISDHKVATPLAPNRNRVFVASKADGAIAMLDP